LKQIAKSVGRVREDALMLTIRAFGWALYLACGRPFLLVQAGWRLSALPVANDFSPFEFHTKARFPEFKPS
jgi:hypothetical protein